MSTTPTLALPAVAESLTTYTEAVKRGDYDINTGGLRGKYDNVRTYWEDQLTRLVLRPYLTDMMRRKQRVGAKVRIADLGCGAGQGYELLTRIDQQDLDLALHHQRVINKQDIECYLGLDLSHAMVARGNELYEENPTVQFVQGDLCDGLGPAQKQAPFDIYYSAYGSLSHLDTPDLTRLLVEIARHGRNGSLVVLDLLGRYSLEWPGYWSAHTDAEKYADYSMSYLQADWGLAEDVEHFPIRYWTGAEIDELVAEVRATSGVSMEILKKYDRSLLVGRHVDTREFNPHLKPIRRMVNRLHEDYQRTELSRLHFDTALPPHPDPAINAFFTELTDSWNTLVAFFERRLQGNIALIDMEGWGDFSPPLQFALMTVDRVINDAAWMWYGDPRANILEPQLGYALRSLEHRLQRGLGCGHGLLVLLQVVK